MPLFEDYQICASLYHGIEVSFSLGSSSVFLTTQLNIVKKHSASHRLRVPSHLVQHRSHLTPRSVICIKLGDVFKYTILAVSLPFLPKGSRVAKCANIPSKVVARRHERVESPGQHHTVFDWTD